MSEIVSPIFTPRACAFRFRCWNASGVPFAGCATGVGQPVSDPPEPLADVRRTDARSAEIDRPCGVARSFQISEYKVEPLKAVLACNLLANDNIRLALGDELEEERPEVSVVGEAALLPRRRERLAGTGTGPDGSVVGPSSEPEGVRPSANPGEEMRGNKSAKVGCVNIDN
jgi:hypothetical protein